MSPINKYEAIGIFASVSVMALALALLRFETIPEGTTAQVIQNQVGGVVVVEETENEEGQALTDALIAASTQDGELKNLVIDDITIGTGLEVRDGDTVTVHYIGSTQDGIQFDSSYLRGEPFQFTVGSGKVIEGWEKGLIGMQVGGERVLVIPSDMAYGNRQVGPIEANATLVFAIELLEIK